jgi:two-component system sensor histidine kinase AtoS
MRIGLLTLDKTGCVRLFNSIAEQLLGYRAQDVLGQPGESIVNGLTQLLTGASGKKRGDKHETQLKLNARHKDGREIPLLATAHTTSGADDAADRHGETILLFEDAAEAEKLENQLRHLNKLQSLDQFAAGIVHEIRNPLAGISTNAQYMMENIGPKDRFQEEVRDILADVKNIEDVASRVLDFAHPTKSHVREEPIEAIVEEVLRFSKMPLRRLGIRLQTELSKTPAKVKVDASQVKQVFFNIVRNACEAMPKGGELRVSTSRRDGTGNGHAQVCVEVEDTGRGIAEEFLERIFDPFFSLNREGTGLGLAISRKIIENHGGRIEVKSKPGKGTKFGIVLPTV